MLEMRRYQTSDELFDKIMCFAALGISIELVFFKFIPDIGTAFIQSDTSTLTDFAAFERVYLAPGSVHHARFMGNYLLYYFAKFLGIAIHSTDIRLHPLRIAAAIVTPLYAYMGAIPVWKADESLGWRAFLAPYAFAVIISLYIFNPCDMPSLAFLGIGLYFLLQERLAMALAFMLIVGLFRETSFHLVWFVAVWMLCARSLPLFRRLAWLALFAAAFAVEYLLIRRYFPGPLSSTGGITLDPRILFFDKGMVSLTTLCSLTLAALFPVVCWARLSTLARTDWRRLFFAANCLAFPLWIIFYRMLNGNMSEFRMLLPVILPCFYGIAYAPHAGVKHNPGLADKGSA
jgi:hypothetical protein